MDITLDLKIYAYAFFPCASSLFALCGLLISNDACSSFCAFLRHFMSALFPSCSAFLFYAFSFFSHFGILIVIVTPLLFLALEHIFVRTPQCSLQFGEGFLLFLLVEP